MSTATRGRDRGGFTLLETLAVMAGLSVLVTLSTFVVLGAFQIQNTNRDFLDRQGYRMGLFDQFRADVAGAAEAPARWEGINADAACLILHQADGKHVVYRLEGKRLQRRDRNTPEGAPFWVELQPVGVEAEFRREGPEGRLITLRLTQVAGRGATKRPMEVTAALGGDLK